MINSTTTQGTQFYHTLTLHQKKRMCENIMKMVAATEKMRYKMINENVKKNRDTKNDITPQIQANHSAYITLPTDDMNFLLSFVHEVMSVDLSKLCGKDVCLN